MIFRIELLKKIKIKQKIILGISLKEREVKYKTCKNKIYRIKKDEFNEGKNTSINKNRYDEREKRER